MYKIYPIDIRNFLTTQLAVGPMIKAISQPPLSSLLLLLRMLKVVPTQNHKPAPVTPGKPYQAPLHLIATQVLKKN